MAEISHAGYLVENLKPPGPSELGLEGHLDVKKFYLPGKLHGQDKLAIQGSLVSYSPVGWFA